MLWRQPNRLRCVSVVSRRCLYLFFFLVNFVANKNYVLSGSRLRVRLCGKKTVRFRVNESLNTRCRHFSSLLMLFVVDVESVYYLPTTVLPSRRLAHTSHITVHRFFIVRVRCDIWEVFLIEINQCNENGL